RRSRIGSRGGYREPSGAHRLGAKAILAAALALAVLTGESAAGAVGSGSQLKTLAPRSGWNSGGSAARAPVTDHLERGQFATSRGNDSRDGWYPNQPGLSPKVVGSSDFGQIFA